MIVPMFEDLLGWTEFEISLFFCGAGVDVSIINETIVMCLLVLYGVWLCIVILLKAPELKPLSILLTFTGVNHFFSVMS